MAGPGSAGPEVYDSSSAPLNPQQGDFWHDGSVLRLRRGVGWLVIGGDVNLLSNKISVLSQAVSVISQQVSVISQQVSVLSQNVSVLSQGLSVLSQATSVADAALSVRINTQSQSISVISAGLGGVQLHAVGDAQVISGTTTTQISGLSVSVAAAATYQFEGMVVFDMSVADAVIFNLSGPVSATVAGTFEVGTGASARTLENFQAFPATVSATPATTSIFTCKIDGVVRTSAAAGTVALFLLTSAADKDVNIRRGSFLRAYKVE